MAKTITIATGLTKDNKHLKLMSKTTPVEVTRGQLVDVTVYLVAVIDLSFVKQYFRKEVDTLQQYDTEIKARRKFDRLNVINN